LVLTTNIHLIEIESHSNKALYFS